jgi:hypothetical protein
VELRVDHRHIARRGALLAGLAASVVAWPSAAPAGAACPPVALVEGSAEITRPVTMILTQHGLAAGPSSCGARVIHALLSKDEMTRAYSLRIVDGYGRTSDRQVADLTDAASLIESWATQEDADVLLPPPEVAPLVISQAPPPASPPPPAGRWRLLAAGEISRASDGSTWYGGAATGCARIGVVCLGARGRLARDGGRAIWFADLNRTSGDLSAVAAAGFSRGRVTIGPMIGAGVRWTRSHLTAPPLAFSADDFGFHAEAAAVVAVALARRWSVVAEVGGSAGVLLQTRAANVRTPPFTIGGGVDTTVPPLPPGADFRVALGCQFRP